MKIKPTPTTANSMNSPLLLISCPLPAVLWRFVLRQSQLIQSVASRRAILSVFAVLLIMVTPRVDAQVTADFTGGNGSVTADQFPGVAGSGWMDAWTEGYGVNGGTMDAFPPTVTFLNPLNGGGNHLIFGFAGTSTSSSAEGAMRRKYSSFGTLDISQTHIIEFDVRVDSWAPPTGFDSGNDSITLTSRAVYGSNPSSDSTWYIRAQGADNNGPPFGKANKWGFFHGGEFSSANDAGVFTNYFPFSIGVTYHFKIEQDPPTKTYIATISDGTNSLTTQRLRWRSYSSVNASNQTNSTILHFIGRVSEAASESQVIALDSVHIYPAPSDTLRPVIANLSPAAGTVYQPAASGLSFITYTLGPTNTIATSNISLILNGTNVSGSLVIGGNATNRTVSYAGLVSNRVYNATITVSDQAARTMSKSFMFDTFVAANVTIIEAENYNFNDSLCGTRTNSSSAGYLQYPAPSYFNVASNAYVNETNGYVDRVGTADVDYHDVNSLGGFDFRICDTMGTRVATDYLRPAYVVAGAPDYALHRLQPGEWMNYTHVFSNRSYRVYLRASCSATQRFELHQVTSDRTQPNQTTVPMGTFIIPPTAGLDTYTYAPLSDAAGNPVTLTLNGEKTLRLLRVGLADDDNDVYLNFMAIVPQAGAAPPYLASVFPEMNASNMPPQTEMVLVINSNAAPIVTNTIILRINGTNVTVGSSIIATPGGVAVSNLPPAFFARLSYNTVQIICGDALGNFMTNQWSFHVGTYLPGTKINVNFQRPPVFWTTPIGYFSDYGYAFGDRANGYSYGWNRDVTIDGRETAGCNTNMPFNTYMAYNTFMHLQRDPERPVFWEITLPNGQYYVHVVAGDASAVDSDYELGVENTLVCSGVPDDSQCDRHWIDGGTNSVTVSDGRLTLASMGGANNKVCFINIATDAPAPDFRLRNPAVSGSTFTFTINSISRALYIIEYKEKLTDPAWSTLTNVVGTGGSVMISDPIGSSRVYRMRVP